MRKLIVATQMSLDGFIAGPDGEMDWLIYGEQEWAELLKDLRSVDTILLGRKMYPDYAAHWRAVLAGPASDPYQKKYAQFADKTSHVVFSKTMSNADWKNTQIARDAEKEVSELKQQSGKDLIIWGGSTMISALLNLNLVDELRITLTPIVLGGGLPLFKNMNDRNQLELIDSRQLKSGVVILRYKLSQS